MNILLIRLRLIGDVVFTTPAIRALRRHLPGARLSYLVERDAAPVVQTNPHLDAVLIAPRRRGVARVTDDVRLAWQLRRERFDVAIDFHGGPRSAWLALASGAPRRLGYAIPGRAWMYTDTVPRARELRPRHSVENQWDLLAPLGGPFAAPPDPRTDAVEMPEDLEAASAVDRRLRSMGVQPEHELIVIHVSAGNPFRRWPAAAFADLADQLAAGGRARRILLTSGPSDAAAAAAIGDAVRARNPAAGEAILFTPELDLPQLRATIARAALFIGGDSGPLHIAATTTVPVVGIFGPTLPARSAPWRDARYIALSSEPAPLTCRPCNQRICEPGDFRCLTGQPAERVAAAAERALAGGRARRADRTAAAL